MVLGRLAISNLKAHRMRVALTAGAIALSVSLVVAVTSGYASLEGAVYKYLTQYMGAMDAQVYRRNGLAGGIERPVLGELRRDPAVLRVVERLEARNGIVDR